MTPYLRLDERLHFYQDVIKTLFNHDADFRDKLRFIHKYKLPVNLVSIADQMHLINAKKAQLTLFDYRNEEVITLMQAFDIRDFFDGWDILLIISYMEYVNAQVEFLPRYVEFERSDFIDVLVAKLYNMLKELKESIGYLATDIRDKGKQRQNEYESMITLEENYKSFLESYLYGCHQQYNAIEITNKIIREIRKTYYSLSALDDEFINMYEYLGVILYHGSDHPLCEVMHEQLRDEVEKEFYALSFSQKVALVDECNLDDLIDDIDMYMLEDVSDLQRLVLKNDAFRNIIDILKSEFLTDVPKYEP